MRSWRWHAGNSGKGTGARGACQGRRIGAWHFVGKGAEDLGESWVAWLMARISLDEATRLIQSVGKNENQL